MESKIGCTGDTWGKRKDPFVLLQGKHSRSGDLFAKVGKLHAFCVLFDGLMSFEKEDPKELKNYFRKCEPQAASDFGMAGHTAIAEALPIQTPAFDKPAEAVVMVGAPVVIGTVPATGLVGPCAQSPAPMRVITPCGVVAHAVESTAPAVAPPAIAAPMCYPNYGPGYGLGAGIGNQPVALPYVAGAGTHTTWRVDKPA